jgi:hypothetical protein
MVITKDYLTQKLSLLEAQYKQLIDNANACSGAIQYAKLLIQELDAPEPATPSATSTKEVS